MRTQTPLALFVCSNANQVRIFQGIITGLQTEGYVCHILSLDRYYNKKTTQEAARQNYPCTELKNQKQIENWWSYAEKDLFPFVAEADEHAEEVFRTLSPSIAIFGNDYGPVEQVLLRAAERVNALTVKLQDGHQGLIPVDTQNIAQAAMIGDGNCDLVFTWSKPLAENILARGAGGKVSAAGNPFYDQLARWPGYQKHAGPYTVLVGTQSFSAYNMLTPGQEIAMYEHICRQFLRRSDVQVVLKIHPGSDLFEGYQRFKDIFPERFNIDSTTNSLQLMQQGNIDLVAVITSTVAFESRLLGIPTYRLFHLLSKNPQRFSEAERHLNNLIAAQNFPYAGDFGFHSPKSELENHSIALDGQATSRILQEIVRAAEQRQSPAATTKSLTVISELNPLDPRNQIRAILRDSSVAQLILIDRSADNDIAQRILAEVQDKRLTIAAFPKQNLPECFLQTAKQCSTEFLAWIDSTCLATPAAFQNLQKALTLSPTTNASLGWFQYRDEANIARSIHPLRGPISARELLALQLAPFFIRCYAWRKSALLDTSGLQTLSDLSFHAGILQRLSGAHSSEKRLAIAEQVVSLGPWKPTKSYLPSQPQVQQSMSISTSNPEVSVILCSYNREEKVANCLAALKDQTVDPGRYEVVCVNDGSTDKTGAVMQAFLKQMNGVYCEHERNKALAAARNTAIRAARGKLLVFINDDTYAEPDFIEQHLRSHQELKGAKAAVLGFLPFLPHLRKRVFSQALMEHNLYFGFNGLQERTAYPFWLFITGNLSVPRAAFVENNIWFDETFLRYGYEDIECGYRLFQLGYRVFYNPQARMLHDHLIDIKNYVKREADNAANILQFVMKHPDPVLSMNLLNVPLLTSEVIQQWRTFVGNADGQLDEAVTQIAGVENIVPSGSSTEAMRATAQLIKDVAETTRLVGYLTKIKTFLTVLEEHPEIQQALLSPQWEAEARRRSTASAADR